MVQGPPPQRGLFCFPDILRLPLGNNPKGTATVKTINVYDVLVRERPDLLDSLGEQEIKRRLAESFKQVRESLAKWLNGLDQ